MTLETRECHVCHSIGHFAKFTLMRNKGVKMVAAMGGAWIPSQRLTTGNVAGAAAATVAATATTMDTEAEIGAVVVAVAVAGLRQSIGRLEKSASGVESVDTRKHSARRSTPLASPPGCQPQIHLPSAKSRWQRGRSHGTLGGIEKWRWFICIKGLVLLPQLSVPRGVWGTISGYGVILLA